MLALRNLGVDAPADELSILFDTFDTDHGGSISYKELNKQLRAGADADLSQITVKDKFGNIIDVNLAAGAAGAIESRAELIARGAAVSHEARRKKGSAFHGSERLVASQESGSVQTQLRDILKENAVRVIDLFRDWDDDQSGTITFKEFRRAIGALGYEAPPDDLRAVFDSFDNDKGGTIELSELNKHLRRGADILLDPALRDGAAGEIVLESKNLNRRSLPEQLAVALAAKADSDPRAALRRTGMALAGRPQSVLLQQRGSARLPQPAPQSPRSFQRAALLFAHHHATSKTATRFPSPRSPRHQLADPVLEAVERHERAQAHHGRQQPGSNRPHGARGAHSAAAARAAGVGAYQAAERAPAPFPAPRLDLRAAVASAAQRDSQPTIDISPPAAVHKSPTLARVACGESAKGSGRRLWGDPRDTALYLGHGGQGHVRRGGGDRCRRAAPCSRPYASVCIHVPLACKAGGERVECAG